MTGSRTSRRTFLRAGAVAAAGTLLAGCVSNPGSRPSGGRATRPDGSPAGPQTEAGMGRRGQTGPGPGTGEHHAQHEPGDHHAQHAPHDHVYSGGAGTPVDPVAEERTLAEWFANVENYDGVVDMTGRAEVAVRVGAPGNGGEFAFAPPAVRVTPGTTVTWEWTGKGGAHDVVAVDGSFASELLAEAGSTVSHVFDRPGTYRYYCTPHRSLGMKGAVVVGAT